MSNTPKYPATMTVHWATGPVDCCDQHGQALIGLGNMLGSHVVATKLEAPAECSNCVGEHASDLASEHPSLSQASPNPHPRSIEGNT